MASDGKQTASIKCIWLVCENKGRWRGRSMGSDYFPTRGGGNEWAAIASLNNVLYYIGGVLLVKVEILKQCWLPGERGKGDQILK